MKIYIIVTQRNDAVGIVQDEYINELKNRDINFSVLVLKKKRNTRGFNKFLTYIKNFSTLYIFLLKVKNNPVHFFSHGTPYPLIMILFPRKKSIITIHHLDKENINRFFSKVILRIYFKSFKRIIAISDFTRNQIIANFNIDPQKISIIYNGINHRNFKPIRWNYSYKYILYVGSETPRKNFRRALKAFSIVKKSYPSIKLIKIGYANINKELYLKNTKSLIEKLGLIIDKDVIFKGYVSLSELPKYYSNAELFLFPSLLEGFGIPIIEAMSCGCPVVTSEIPPMSELVKETQIKVNPYNEVDISKGILKVLQDSRLRKKMVYEGIKLSKQYSWKRNVEQSLNIYEQLIEN